MGAKFCYGWHLQSKLLNRLATKLQLSFLSNSVFSKHYKDPWSSIHIGKLLGLRWFSQNHYNEVNKLFLVLHFFFHLLFATSFFFFFLSSRTTLFHSFEERNFSINMLEAWKNIFRKHAKTMKTFFPQKFAKNFYLPHSSSKVLKDENSEAHNNTHPIPFLKHHPFIISQKIWNTPIHLCWSTTLQKWWPFDKAIVVCHNVSGLDQHQAKALAYWCGSQDKKNSCMGRLIFHGNLDGGQLTYLWQDINLPWTLFSSILFVYVIFISLQFFIIT